MTFDQYRQVEHVVPYVCELHGDDGRLLYFGARHSFDPADEQLRLLESLWAQFAPTLALNEGGDPPVAPTRNEAVGRYAEAGLVRFLAARDGVPCMTLEPSPHEITARLLDEFSAEELVVCYVLRDYIAARRSAYPPDPEMFLQHQLESVAEYRGVPAGSMTVKQFRAAHARLFPGSGTSWSDVTVAAFDPAAPQPQSRTQQFSRRSSELRDLHMIDLLRAHLKRGERVFAVVGASHVVMQEPELRRLLHDPADRDALTP